jgi:glutathione S-transferase
LAKLKLYHAPMTRSVRIVWLLEELGLPYEIEKVEFVRPKSGTFAQNTPFGKLPVLEDGDTVIFESGAIVQYILERHADGRLAPAIGRPRRGEFLQWMSYAESTAYAPLAGIIWPTLYKDMADRVPEIIDAARERAWEAFEFLQTQLGDRTWILGDEFSGADIMLGFTLEAANVLRVLTERFPGLRAYLERLKARDAFKRAMAV